MGPFFALLGFTALVAGQQGYGYAPRLNATSAAASTSSLKILTLKTSHSTSKTSSPATSSHKASPLSTSLKTSNPSSSQPAQNVPYCTTVTQFDATLTYTDAKIITTCTSYSTHTVNPTVIHYTGTFDSQPIPTSTGKVYGDLYSSGELSSTPTCVPTPCSGTSTSYITGTTRLRITQGATTMGLLCATTTTGVTGTAAAIKEVTRHERCAPTNLVHDVRGHGIYRPAVASGARVEMVDTTNVTDPSACCQICAERDNCAAGWSTVSDGEVGVCALALVDSCPALSAARSASAGSSVLSFSDSARYEYDFLDPDSVTGYNRVFFGCGHIGAIVYEENCV
ncbi:hypothetical protein K470DRAFT_270673 [Piedraia hortae CBS 480.64]|uniref:Apple domain-containing protein n=1 Tax=Piedraia hortae CBS 480.64 TaxID=1314780 RepID=A0A6A7BZA3_9PEZI|nr:hypothetical protein K470DRAFT_270673 [Piedraia hortae CBS 480.64]